MSRVRHDLVTRLWRGRDPFLDLPPDLREVDMRGTSPGHHFFASAVASAHPGVVADIGAGKGGSTLAFARELRDARMNAAVVAIDTFLGGITDWNNDDEFKELEYEAGRSSLYPRFVSNVLQAGLGNFVLPLTLDATTAAALFAQFGILASIVNLDAGNDPASIRSYLEAWWPLLAPGGVLIGGPCGDGNDAARQTYESFFAARGMQPTFQDDRVCAAKPGGPAAATVAQAAAPVTAPAAASPSPEPQPQPAGGYGGEEPRRVASSFRLGGRLVARAEGA